MSVGTPTLLIASFLLLLVSLGAALAIFVVNKRQKQLQKRITEVTGPFAQVVVAGTRSRSQRQVIELVQPGLRFLARLFGCDTSRLAEYPVPWWVALGGSLIAARLLTELFSNIVGWIALTLTPLLCVMISRFFFGWCHSRRSNKLYVQFPDALSMIVRGVRVGIPVSEAIKTVSREALEPTSVEFQKLSDQLSIGVSLPDALKELSDRNSLPEYQFFATALALQSQTGGGLSETLDNLADVIRKRVALRSRAIALASEAKTSIFILASLPIVAGAALAVLNPDYISLLFTSDSGKKVLAVAVTMLGIGIGSMQTIVKKSLS